MMCPHCAQPVFRTSDGGAKLKARTTMLVLHKGGEVEINCSSCGKGVCVPLVLKDAPFELTKAEAPVPRKLVVRRI